MPFTQHFKVVVTIGMDSGLPEDAVQNTWHFDEVTAGGLSNAITALGTFYQAIDGVILSSAIDGAKCTYTVYDMADPEPRAPVEQGTLVTLTTASQARAPELAMCLSFQGDPVSGLPQRNRRGRVYLGPLANIEVSTTNPQIATSTVDAIAAAGDDLVSASNAAANWTWCVFSEVLDDLIPVTNGWVDNAFDIQRRRGLEATYRATFQ